MTQCWSEKHYIHSDNSDYKKDCKLSTLLEWMQRAGDADITQSGIILEELMQRGMAWMLTTVDLEIYRMPRYGETIQLDTWHKGSKGVQWLRDFRIYGPDQEQVAQARTVWVLVDLNKRRILRASALPYEVQPHTSDSVGEVPERVEIPSNILLDHAYDLKVRQSSIDMNGHMNNTKFADVCLDALTVKRLDAGITRFRITYHQEARLDEEITVFRSCGVDSGSCFVSGRSGEGKKYFDAEVSLKC
ncbi:thioesterase [Paenibacillus sp. ACRRX]|uniref:acyl-[acyl-carrier-protein] thioesterase n=1 Tax=Paenibacillus sp. ACRRX TaxID=2918206 RepID=UPI001EF4D7BC|nr:acyl-ACP thioesterase domain-containing protein [Paenibacillus sp. ACRRX]MCG7409667.1 thioesterase [Paenibacillus sp. ACRRX]